MKKGNPFSAMGLPDARCHEDYRRELRSRNFEVKVKFHKQEVPSFTGIPFIDSHLGSTNGGRYIIFRKMFSLNFVPVFYYSVLVIFPKMKSTKCYPFIFRRKTGEGVEEIRAPNWGAQLERLCTARSPDPAHVH